MANNKLHGYTPKTSNEKDGNRLDRLNPNEFKKGMDYELTEVGCYRLAESTFEERETATEKVIKNLQEYGGYYSALISYETEYRNPVEGGKKPSFKAYLKEMEEYQMIEVDKKYSNDKMTEPKYKKEDYTTKFETGKMGNFKLKALKEAIREEIQNNILNEAEICWFGRKNYANSGHTCVARGCNFSGPTSNPGGWASINGGVGYENKSECNQWMNAMGVGSPGTNNPTLAINKTKHQDTSQYNNTGGVKGMNKIKAKALSEAKKDKDVYDTDDELEPSKSQIKGIDKSIGDAKEALAQAIKKIKELGPDIKKLAKETNDKIKKNPAGKADYLKTYTTNPDVKEFIKLRKMLKSADLLK
tara:strand:- start:1108 stop:2184 length:1077 start_codon:yes stop_codon:yes gene_type:complete